MQDEQEIEMELNELRKKLQIEISNLTKENHRNRYIHYFLEDKDTIDYANTTIRISPSTRNKLKNILKPEETYEELIIRLINVYERFHEEKIRQLNESQVNLVEFHAREFMRHNNSIQYYPDIKIEYSYNESLFHGEGFIFDLNIGSILHKGIPISQEEGTKLLLLINTIKNFRDIINRSRIDQILDTKKLALQDKIELIKTKYITYFKVLYLLTNKNLKIKYKDINELITIDFWKRVYSYYDLPTSSFEHDVCKKIKSMELELEQEKTNFEKLA